MLVFKGLVGVCCRYGPKSLVVAVVLPLTSVWAVI